MSAQNNEERDMSGVLFPNAKKQASNQPSMYGNCLIEGKRYRISAWTRFAASSGRKYLSMALESEEAYNERVNKVAGADAAPAKPKTDELEDLPF